MPLANPGEDLIRQMAAIISQPVYQVRLVFAGPLPKIIAHYKDEALAMTAVDSIKKLGVIVFPIAETELKKPASVRLLANRIETGEGNIKFISRTGESVTIEQSGVFLLLTGRRAVTTQTAGNITHMKLNLPATLLTGGLPMMKTVTTSGEKREQLVEGFIKIYDGESDTPMVEIRQGDFDYSSLGSQMACTAKTNFACVLESLKRSFSPTFFDQNLSNGFPLESHRASGTDWVEETCRLLYRYYQALGKPPTSPPLPLTSD